MRLWTLFINAFQENENITRVISVIPRGSGSGLGMGMGMGAGDGG
ncbi:MAG: hypothetical protein ACKV0T_22375 [Planctomycetales bacterium]